jgi:hypothetical protein
VRALKHGELVPEVVHTKGIHIGVKNRISLVKMILESEKTIGSKAIEEEHIAMVTPHYTFGALLCGTTIWTGDAKLSRSTRLIMPPAT